MEWGRTPRNYSRTKDLRNACLLPAVLPQVGRWQIVWHCLDGRKAGRPSCSVISFCVHHLRFPAGVVQGPQQLLSYPSRSVGVVGSLRFLFNCCLLSNTVSFLYLTSVCPCNIQFFHSCICPCWGNTVLPDIGTHLSETLFHPHTSLFLLQLLLPPPSAVLNNK